MKLRHGFKIAINGILTHKSRSALTVLGIVIGITSIILVMSVGEGAQNMILDQVKGIGAKTIVIEPGREPTGPSDFVEIFTDSLKLKDIESIKNPSNVQGITRVSPMVVLPANLSYKTETTRTTIWGTDEFITQIMDVYPIEGAFFKNEKIKRKSHVAVIGHKIKRDLFGLSSALGQKIRIKNRTFRIVGVLPPKGNVMMTNVDQLVFIPYSTAQDYLLGINYFHALMAEADSEENVPRVTQEIKLTLRENHNITDPTKDDFHITTQEDAVDRVSMITTVLQVLLISIAAISLIVGGIGIMNIMIVSVTERTKEIGLRKAIGATRNDILLQFLLESIVLTILGGIIGVILGGLFAYLTAFILSRTVITSWTFVFPLSAVLLGIGVSGTVGLIFGIFPAQMAAKKDPIEALRYE